MKYNLSINNRHETVRSRGGKAAYDPFTSSIYGFLTVSECYYDTTRPDKYQFRLPTLERSG